jgi:hypothetical protein
VERRRRAQGPAARLDRLGHPDRGLIGRRDLDLDSALRGITPAGARAVGVSRFHRAEPRVEASALRQDVALTGRGGNGERLGTGEDSMARGGLAAGFLQQLSLAVVDEGP